MGMDILEQKWRRCNIETNDIISNPVSFLRGLFLFPLKIHVRFSVAM